MVYVGVVASEGVDDCGDPGRAGSKNRGRRGYASTLNPMTIVRISNHEGRQWFISVAVLRVEIVDSPIVAKRTQTLHLDIC